MKKPLLLLSLVILGINGFAQKAGPGDLDRLYQAPKWEETDLASVPGMIGILNESIPLKANRVQVFVIPNYSNHLGFSTGIYDDIGETNNLATQYPERVEQMQAFPETLIVQGRSTPGPVQQNDVEVIRYLQVSKKY